ncbi:TrbI/VirB10 family protein [Phenylobacterium sp. J367]|uniref:TrbI/VirB10 family protein n=1 Tax=Phenylobacterium sp. J367 TaxID=2898435 RepID=UPI0021509FBF
MSTASQPAAREPAEELRLRSARPRVARLSRRVLIALTATSSVVVVGAVAYAMTTHAGGSAPAEVYNVGGQPPERLNALPRDYGAAPRLGPPLPGDLGRPMLEAEVAPPPMAPIGPSDAAQQEVQARRQRLMQERDAARTSRLFSTEAQGQAGSFAEGATSLIEAAASAPAGRRTILDGPVERRTTSPDRLASPPSPFVLQAGAMIPAALLTGVRSDLPGQIVGQVTENVYDSVSGRFLLIPQGSKLIGAYDTQVAFGQSRVLLAWTRLILPNGRSLVLEKLPAGDAQGYAGLQDRVDRHWGALFGAAALSTILGIGAELGEGDDENDILRALRHGAAGSFNQVGQQTVGRSLNIPPTLTIRPGAPVRVMVTRDLVLEPYRG